MANGMYLFEADMNRGRRYSKGRVNCVVARLTWAMGEDGHRGEWDMFL